MTTATKSVIVPYPAVTVIFGMLFAVMFPIYLTFRGVMGERVSWYMNTPRISYLYPAIFALLIVPYIYCSLKYSGIGKSIYDYAVIVVACAICLGGFVVSDTIITNRNTFDNAKLTPKEFRVLGAYTKSGKGVLYYDADVGIKDEYGEHIFVPLDYDTYNYIKDYTRNSENPPLCVSLSEQHLGSYRRILVDRRKYESISFISCEVMSNQ